jgi:hypothetical protein
MVGASHKRRPRSRRQSLLGLEIPIISRMPSLVRGPFDCAAIFAVRHHAVLCARVVGQLGHEQITQHNNCDEDGEKKWPSPCRKSAAHFGRYSAFARLELKRGLGSTRLYFPLVLASAPPRRFTTKRARNGELLNWGLGTSHRIEVRRIPKQLAAVTVIEACGKRRSRTPG